jgi:hypothetical protein
VVWRRQKTLYICEVSRISKRPVGDRENARIQLFDAEGHFLKQWTGIGYPYGLYITPDQHVWMIDGGFDRVVELDQTGKILGAIGSTGHKPGQFTWGHFLAFGTDKRLFVADILNWRFQVFVPRSNNSAKSSNLGRWRSV